MKGSPQQIADEMEEWFRNGGCDGFNLMPPFLPGGLDDFVELVLPELRRRGLFRTEYEGRTLREHLGLLRPPSRYAAARGGRLRRSDRPPNARARRPDSVAVLSHGMKWPRETRQRPAITPLSQLTKPYHCPRAGPAKNPKECRP